MLIVLLVATIIIFIVCINEEEEIFTLFGLAILVELTVGAYLLGLIVNGRTIDSKIEIIEDKNKEIEEKVETSVKAYMEYENKTLSDLKVDSYIQLVNLYPDLKSDDLIKSEIEMYQENIKEVTELKKEKVEISNYKFWLYFGG